MTSFSCHSPQLLAVSGHFGIRCTCHFRFKKKTVTKVSRATVEYEEHFIILLHNSSYFRNETQKDSICVHFSGSYDVSSDDVLNTD